MKTKFLLIGYDLFAISELNVLCAYLRPRDIAKFGPHAMISIHGADRLSDDFQPLEWDTAEEAIAFIRQEIAAGSNWTYFIQPLFT